MAAPHPPPDGEVAADMIPDMNDFIPFENLCGRAQQLIRISEAEMNLKYPEFEAHHHSAIRKDEVVREIMRILIATQLSCMDNASKDSVLRWLDFLEFQLPSQEEAVKQLQHDHIQHQLYSRGIINYESPPLDIKSPIHKATHIPLKSPMPKMKIDGNYETTVLFTTIPNSGIHMTFKYEVNAATGSGFHIIELLLDVPGGGNISKSCLTCAALASSSTSQSYYTTETRILLYNARGAATTTFQSELAKHCDQEMPHLVIVTETRVPSRAAIMMSDSLHFDHCTGLDPVGFCGGNWVMWNRKAADVEIIRKFGVELTMEFKTKFHDPAA